jgi:hypothetical protein
MPLLFTANQVRLKLSNPFPSFISIHYYILKNPMFACPHLLFQIDLLPVPKLNHRHHVVPASSRSTVTSVRCPAASSLLLIPNPLVSYTNAVLQRFYISPTCTGYLNPDLCPALQIAIAGYACQTPCSQVRHIIYITLICRS